MSNVASESSEGTQDTSTYAHPKTVTDIKSEAGAIIL